MIPTLIKFFRICFMFCVGVVGVGLTGLIGAYLFFARDLPNIQTVSDYHPQLASEVFGANGKKIGEFWSDQKRYLVPIEEVPPLLIQSFLAAEDARFFEHRGVDFRGTIRAFLANFRAGGVVQGGSTITQQITRSLLLTRERSFERKIKEAILATRLERYLSKEHILYLYLNEIYLGNRAYGIKAAAENYFHKDLKELNLVEMTILASLPRAPEYYSPLRYPQNTKERQIYVLDRLLDLDAITKEDKEKALKTEVALYAHGVDKDTNLEYAPHFLEHLRTLLLKNYGEDKLYYGGLKIYTPLEPDMQLAATHALRRGLEVFDRRRSRWHGTLTHISPGEIPAYKEKLNVQILSSQKIHYFPPRIYKETPTKPDEIYPAIVIGFEGTNTKVAIGNKEVLIPKQDRTFDQQKLAYTENIYMHDPPHTLKVGDVIQVLAMPTSENNEVKFSFYQTPEVQGALYSQEPKTGYVRAMVGGYDFAKSEFNRTMDAFRQPGSSFKPIIYAAALDKGYTFKTQVADTPFTIPVGHEVWTPKNYDGKFRGITSFHQALVNSYNIATARIAYHIRLHYLTAYLRKLGLTTPVEKYPSMALGANAVRLYEMVAAYATFPNLGIYRPPLFITKVTDQEGKILEEHLIPDVPTPTMAQQEFPKGKKKGVGFNEELLKASQPWLAKDELKLFPSEMKVLYGANIPPGHVMTPQTAYLMVRLMSDVVNLGTGQRVKKLKKPVAGKTGTSNDAQDTWFIGYLPDLAAGVWIGYDNIKTLGKGEQGGFTAAPIFLDFMQEATKNGEAKTFPVPEIVDGKKDLELFATVGGSAALAEYIPMPNLGGDDGGSSADRATDFMEADFERTPGDVPSEMKGQEREDLPSSAKTKEPREWDNGY